MFLIMGVSLYTSRVVLQTLGVEDFGIYNVVGGIVTMFSFLNGSLGAATSRYITFELGRKDYIRLNKIFNVALVTHIVIGLVIVLLAETIGLWFFYEKMVIPEERLNAAFWVYQISILSTLISLTQVPYNATIIAHENMKVYAYVGIIEVVLKLIVIYILIISPFDKLIFYACMLFLINIGIILFYRIYCIRRYQESRIKLCKEKALYKDMFKFAGSDLIGNVSVLAQGQGLNLLLNMFFGPVVNAARAVAYQVQGAVTQFSNNFMTAVRPQIIKSYAEGNLKDMWQLVIQSSNFSYYLMWLICLPIMLETKTILTLWLGEYPDHTVSFMILVLMLCLIQTIKTPRVTIFHAMAKVFWSNITVGVVLCLAFPLAYIFLKMGGTPESVFWAANFTMIASEFVSVAVLRHFLDFSVANYFFQVHGRCLLVTVISSVIPFLLYDKIMEPGILRLMVTCLLTTLSVGVTSFYLGMNKEMRNKIVNMVQAKIHQKK
jgi:O-antigen/teichoic acid export membrane protein